VHSSFKPVPQPDYIIPVEIEGRVVDVYVLKRPFVDHFLRAVGSRFEVGKRSGRACGRLNSGVMLARQLPRPPLPLPSVLSNTPLPAGGCVHCLPGQVRRPAAGPAGPSQRGAVAPLPRGLLPL
jgi:hypothetical protein